MKKRVKNGIEKRYCDVCGKNIFDYIPKEPTIQLGGEWLPEYRVKTYCEYKIINIPYGEYCMECYKAKTTSSGSATPKTRRKGRS